MPRVYKAKNYAYYSTSTRRARALVASAAARSRANYASRTGRTGYGKYPTSSYGRIFSSTQGGHEIKSIDLPVALYPFTAAGSITALNLVSAGSSYFNRIGRKIEMKYLYLNAIVAMNATSTFGYGRIIIVYDKQTNGAAPLVSDVIQTTDQAGANTLTVFSNINLNNRDRFSILRDIRVFLPSGTFTAGVITNAQNEDPVASTFLHKQFISLRGMYTQYRADSAPSVVGDIATGGLFMLVIGDALGYSLRADFRLRYGDQ